jgi:hypothetical protein
MIFLHYSGPSNRPSFGYRHLIAGFSTPHDEESMIHFVEEVLPKLKQI